MKHGRLVSGNLQCLALVFENSAMVELPQIKRRSHILINKNHTKRFFLSHPLKTSAALAQSQGLISLIPVQHNRAKGTLFVIVICRLIFVPLKRPVCSGKHHNGVGLVALLCGMLNFRTERNYTAFRHKQRHALVRSRYYFGAAALMKGAGIKIVPALTGREINLSFSGAILTNGTNHKGGDRKSTRLNSSHVRISYAVLCLKKKMAPS